MARPKNLDTDQKTLGLIDLIKQKKLEIAKSEKPSYKTNCSFVYIEGRLNDSINIHAEFDVRKLICMVAFIQEKEASYANAARTLKIDSPPPFTWNGYSANEWIEDLTMRIKKIQVGTERTKLEALLERLNKIISPELKAQLELEAIESELA